ncbi:ABC transporter substrate-binding protein [Rhizobium sp. S95]|uniref:ABC transporter substrate-binding protein n=1 Tax=Ciceribacter sichuanensis TaxID=2949647 RepID=A0AAJ1F8U8_9HYPH|nr:MULTISPECIES: ABC transporter substrate-binding protein [unclassified Ciceribacter]MCM2398026.1 ABC transporter substrate-binding protein [Ciceribacter sp. S95]MCM2403664.1 ABC transporter substrate-binding protein [Ciceribacter sp. S153]MCO5959377.1 ABC transporter substrate-binding protein [Ciceribacter sp. S101]
MRTSFLLSAVVAALAASTAPTFAADCDITVGLVMELTGPAGEYGQAGAKSVAMAFRDFNEAGGVDGCNIVADTRDSQSQGNVAVDQATQLVNIKKVPVIIGGIISSVSIPILTSVTAPAGVVQVSPASSSPTLTSLGREGKTNGVFFRTITSDALQGTAAAKYAIDQGLKKIAIINVNNDFGVNMVKEFATAYEKLGGTITSTTPYNEKQSSYTSEASAAMAGDPDALYLVSTPVDGATIARAWISGGGKQTFLLNDGMNSKDFIESVGAQYLENAYGTSSGTSPTASTEYFNANYEAFSGGISASAPAADRSYDAGAIVALAIAKAGKADAAAIKAAVPAVVAEGGTPIHAGKEEFAKALALIKEGKPVKYEGVIGPVSFDQYGDITGPFRLWKITNGEVTTVGEMSAEDVSKIKAAQ